MILLIASEKGGTGKTTIATNLAAIRAKNREVMLIDTDPQRSASNWVSMRDSQNNLSQIFCAQKFGSIEAEIKKLSKKFEDIIIDAGGRDSKELRTGMLVADKMYIPMQPSQFDLWSIGRMEEIIGRAKNFNLKLITKVVLNRVSPNPIVNEAKEASDIISEFEYIKISRNKIHERIAFRKSIREGKAVTEVKNKDTKAINEITLLYKEIFNA